MSICDTIIHAMQRVGFGINYSIMYDTVETAFIGFYAKYIKQSLVGIKFFL